MLPLGFAPFFAVPAGALLPILAGAVEGSFAFFGGGSSSENDSHAASSFVTAGYCISIGVLRW